MTDIWLADLARAIAAIDPAPGERAEIMHMLAGTRPARELPAARPREAPEAPRPEPVAPVVIPASREDARPEAESDPTPASPAEPEYAGPVGEPPRPNIPPLGTFRRGLGPLRRARGRASKAGPDELVPAGRQMSDAVEAGRPSMPRRGRTSPAPAPAVAPLLAARSTRSIIWHLLSRRIDDGDVDVDAAVTLLVRQQPLRSIPRVPRHTLRFGVRLLIDRSESMRPYGADQRQLLLAVRHLVGPAITELQYFTGSPLRGVTERPVGRARRYRPPSPGTPVLLLTDFGLRRYLNCAPGAPRHEWEAFLRQHAPAGHRPVALVPFRAERMPDWLGRCCHVVTWDRTTTANAVGTVRR